VAGVHILGEHLARRLTLLVVVLLAASNGAANGGWVIDRDDRGDSPLLKDRKSIAMTEQEQHQRLASAYKAAVGAEYRNIRQHWSAPETSNQTRWVAYSDDYQVKKVVDFKSNQIEISMEGVFNGGRLDFAATNKKVGSELEKTVATRLKDAIENDPVQTAINQVYADLGAASGAAQLETSELVLKELFRSANPSATEIRREAGALMRNASIRYQALNASVASVPVSLGKKMTYVIPMPDNRIRRKVMEFQPLVRSNAKRFDLSEDVVMAIIHTESHFNPLARSHVPAFGLMQIVPSTAGRDATRELYQKPSLLSAQYLYNPKKNIEVGAAYLHVLYYDYFKSIKNPQSRLYYTIAAYNAGASNVAKAFIGKASFTDAVEVVNGMTPDQVLQRLLKQAPHKETRQYLEKVLKRRAYYAKM